MTWKLPTRDDVEKFIGTFPGKKGVDIPADIFDKIHPVANGITQQIWGTSPTPHQLQWLHDNGHHQPDEIHSAFGNLPHPHAPTVTVAEYGQYSQAKQLFDKHQKPAQRSPTHGR